MKKITLTIIIAFILVGILGGAFITAQIIANKKPVTIDVKPETEAKFIELGLTNPETTPMKCEGNVCSFRMYQILDDGTKYKLGLHEIDKRNCIEYELVELTPINGGEPEIVNSSECLNWVDYTLEELETIQGEMIIRWQDSYAVVLETRENKVTEIKGDGLDITLNSK